MNIFGLTVQLLYRHIGHFKFLDIKDWQQTIHKHMCLQGSIVTFTLSLIQIMQSESEIP
jgi:hypothetical protein